MRAENGLVLAGKVLLGLATVAPAAYMVLFLLTVASIATGRPGLLVDFRSLLVMHVLMMLWMAGLLVFYLVYLFRCERVSAEMKAAWAVVLLFGSVIAMPVFFCLYILPDRAEQSE